MKKDIMENIKKIFKRSGLKYIQIEEKLKLPKGRISSYMTKGSNRCFSHEVIKDIAIEFKVSIDSIYGIKLRDDFVEKLEVYLREKKEVTTRLPLRLPKR